MQDLMPPINTPDSAFHDGDPTTGQLGTIVTALWLNNVQSATRDVQLEIKSVLAKAGIQPDPKKTNQLAEAISQIIGSGNYASTAYVDNGLNKKIDKANISGVKGNDNDKVPSLNLFTTETGKLQPKGNYQPAGDYANGTLFYKTGSYSGMRPENLKYAVMMYSDGRLMVWGEDEQKFLLGFNSLGEMINGLIPMACGGTGAKTAADARTNLSVHSKDEVNTALAGKQPVGNYANSDIFYNTASLIGMRTASKNYALVTYENGDVGCWEQAGSKFTFRFNKSGVLTNGSVPASMVTGLTQIGVGQTWQDVKNSRLANTSYTNDTGKPILVNIGGTYLSGSYSSLLLVVDGLTVGGMGGSLAATTPIFTSAIIPPGSTYRVNISGTTASIGTWAELR